MTSKTNITEVREEDRVLISQMAKLDPEKKTLVKGIIIGMQLKGKERTNDQRTDD